MEAIKTCQKTVIYLGSVGAEGTALTIHAQNMARLLKKVGYETLFICDGGTQGMYSSHPEFEYFYTRKYIKIPIFSSLENLFDEFTGYKRLKMLRRRIKLRKPDLVVLYGQAGEKSLIKLCHKNNIPFVVERVDWFDESDCTSYISKCIIRRNNRNIKEIDKYADGIIAISQYLKNYYEDIQMDVTCIPPIFDIEQSREIKRTEHIGKLHLVYAGSLGSSKDQILPVLQALRTINEKEIRISLDIVGITMKQIEEATLQNDWEKLGVKAFGRLKNDEARRIVGEADFSLLLRQNKRYAKAGFSTKFAESMSLGVPVICTKVGGADAVITDMYDGVHLPDNETKTIQNKLEELLAKDSDDISAMKKNAFNSARRLFFIDNYTEQMKDFIDKISNNN